MSLLEDKLNMYEYSRKAVSRNFLISTADRLKSKMQEAYSPHTFPTLEYVLMMSLYDRCLMELTSRHNHFKFV